MDENGNVRHRHARSEKGDDYHGETGRTVDMLALRNLMGLSLSDDTSDQARAIAMYKIEELYSWIKSHYSTEKGENQKAHLFYALNQIDQFKDNPESFRRFVAMNPPDGSPIGMDNLGCSYLY